MIVTTTQTPSRRSAARVRVHWPLQGLRWRLILYLGASLVILLGAFAFLSLQAARRAQGQALAQQLQLAQAVARGLGREFDHISSEVYFYLPTPPSPTSAPEALASLQNQLAHWETAKYFRLNAVRMVDADGNVLAASAGAPTLEETLPTAELIQRAVSQGVPLVGVSHLPVDEGSPFAAIVVPLPPSDFSQGEALVVDTVGLGAVDLFSSPATVGYQETEETQNAIRPYNMEVLSPEGVVRATSLRKQLLGANSFHHAPMKQFMDRKVAGVIVHRPGNGRPDHIVAGVPVGDTPFFLIAEEPLGLLLDWPAQLRNQATILSGIAALVILVLGWLVGRQIVQPLRALRRATARIKEGDLDTPVQVKSQGEVAQLVAEVEAMRQRLQHTVSSLDALTRNLSDQVQERTQRLQVVVQRLMGAQEEERRRVARDLHDETAQGLSALGVFLDEVAFNAEGGGDRVLGSIRVARRQVNRLVEETRRLAYALRPSVLDDKGLVPALRWCAEAYLQASGVHVSFHVSQPDLRYPETLEVALFRVGQEAMSNIAKHAQASNAAITLQFREGWLTLTIKDDGLGFDVGAVMEQTGTLQGRGLGLAGIEERMVLLGGRMDVSSAPGQGTTVTASVPASVVE
ncbi:MAG: sensor histidine kinase [Chloroflexi bacterium]|nr:sensor histidine kinase [Chloroflexota bacterium]